MENKEKEHMLSAPFGAFLVGFVLSFFSSQFLVILVLKISVTEQNAKWRK